MILSVLRGILSWYTGMTSDGLVRGCWECYLRIKLTNMYKIDNIEL